MKILSDKNYIILEAQAASFKSERKKCDSLEKKYKDLQRDHEIIKSDFEKYKKISEKRIDNLFEKESALFEELNKYKEFYKIASTEGFKSELGDWVLKVFQLRINQTLSSSSKDITYLGSGTDEFGLYFLYSAVVWESSKIDLSKKTL